MAAKGVAENPKTVLLGWGQESFNYIFNKYYDPRLYTQEQWFDRTHNVVFDWLVAGGILGLGTYLLFFVSLFWYLWKHTRMSVSEKSILTGLLVGYFIHNLFVFDNIVSYIIFFLFAAYVQSKSTVLKEESFGAQTYRTSQPNRIILPVSIIVTLLVLYVVNYKPVMANYALISALSNHSPAAQLGLSSAPFGGDVTTNVSEFQKALSYNSFGTSEVREQIFSMASGIIGSNAQVKGSEQVLALAIDQSQAQIDATPNDARYYVLDGVLYNRMNRYADATKVLEKARTLSPHKQSLLFELGASYMGQQKFKEAEAVYKQAYELDTSYKDAEMFYAISALYANDQATVTSVLSKIPKKDLVENDQLLYAYYQLHQYNKVIDLWKARVAETPMDPQSHVSLAAAYLLIKDNKDAIAEIQKAIDIYPAFKTQGEDYIKQIREGKLTP
jgi:tetratricopeptide (TPR) repeat protein